MGKPWKIRFSWLFMIFMVFPGFHEFWREVLQNCKESSCGGWVRPEKHRSSTFGGRKVVCDVIFLSADMFRAGFDTHFSWVRPLLGPPNYCCQ